MDVLAASPGKGYFVQRAGAPTSWSAHPLASPASPRPLPPAQPHKPPKLASPTSLA